MSARLYPRDVAVGDEILIRATGHGGWYTDAGTVARGKRGRRYVTVIETQLGGNWPTIVCDVDGSKLDVAGSANSKLIVRKPVVG